MIIKSDNNYLFGGYTSTSWKSMDNYVADTKSFIFTLTNPHEIQPTRYNCKNNLYSICDTAAYGPAFGGGHDINVSPTFDSASYTNFPHTYIDTTGKGNITFTGNSKYTPADVEIFQVS
jgi:hypothetical protein